MCITDLMKGWDCLNNKGEPIVVRKYGFKAENLAAMQKKIFSCLTAALWCKGKSLLVCFFCLSENL